MSSPFPVLHPPAASPDLLSLRAELDRLDDALHDTLMRRAEVVTQVAGLRVKGSVPLRPGREAAIISRLVARHSGAMPASGIVRIWRELLATTTAQQRPLLIAVCQPDGDPAHLAIAREHFGALTPLRVHDTSAQAISEVSAGIATVGVLPLPTDDEASAAAWWTALLHEEPRIHVVGRLPFWLPRPEGSPKVQALLVSAAAPDPSGRDRSLLGLELPPEVSRAQLGAAIAAAGFRVGTTILHQVPGTPVAQALVDVDGFVGEDDARLSALQSVLRPRRLVILGAYAQPLGGEEQ
jgi:chorismate mutase